MNEENSSNFLNFSNTWQENISLLKETINQRGIETDIKIDDNYLIIVLKGSPQMSSAILAKELGDFINNLTWSSADHSVEMVTLSAQDVTNNSTLWQIDFAINPSNISESNHQPNITEPNIWGKFTNIAGNINKSVANNSHAVWENISNTLESTKNTVSETVNNTTKNVGDIASHTTENM
ncbi:MAG: hypothetical protein ACRC2J_01795, partial [Microcoleaceae cyanobacterium]